MTIHAAKLRKGQCIIWDDGEVEQPIAKVGRINAVEVSIHLKSGAWWIERATRVFNVK